MGRKLAIIFPDLDGKVSKEFLDTKTGFIEQLMASQPTATIIPAINGEFSLLQDIYEAMKCEFIRPVMTIPGLPNALFAACQEALGTHTDFVVRLDPTEHPVDCIQTLVDTAMAVGGVAIGDLTFSEELMQQNTPDYIYHKKLFPALYSAATDGKLAISSTHGFCAMSNRNLYFVASKALGIWNKARELNGDEPITWAFDGMMYLAAIRLVGLPIQVMPIAGQRPRNHRLATKIANRFHDHSLAVTAAMMLT